jgi:DNA-binding MarR family transcriptional regulator
MSEARPGADQRSSYLLAGIHVVSNRISRAFAAEVTTRHGIKLAEWRVLVGVKERPKTTAGAITRRWGLEKMAVNRAVRRLQDMGCLTVTPDPEDRRRLTLSLTAEGERLFETIEPDATRRYREIVALLSADERRALGRILDKLTAGTEAME